MSELAEADVAAAPPIPEEKPTVVPSREPECNKLFRMVMKHEASDLHLKVGQPPMMRMRVSQSVQLVATLSLSTELRWRVLSRCCMANMRARPLVIGSWK